jgi:hypothetical protein
MYAAIRANAVFFKALEKASHHERLVDPAVVDAGASFAAIVHAERAPAMHPKTILFQDER